MGEQPDENADRLQLLEKMAGYYSGALTSNLIVLGDKLGIYKALGEIGPCTTEILAQKLGFNARYVAEYCRQQASAGIISHDENVEMFFLTDAQKDVLVHEHGPNSSAFFGAGGFESLPDLNRIAAQKLPEIFKSGQGLKYDDFGHGCACGTCRELGVWQRHFMVNSFNTIPGLSEKFQAGITVADVGCGCGQAVIECAKAFPNSTFHGYDISEKAMDVGRKWAQEQGLTNVEFRNPGVDEEQMPQGYYDLAMTHDAIHDMAHPTQVMSSVHKGIKADGVWIIGDMTAMDSHAENVKNHPMATFMYGFSCHLCLPSAMSAEGAAGIGTLGLSIELMAKMSKEAGFSSCEVLGTWDHPLNRYYLLKA